MNSKGLILPLLLFLVYHAFAQSPSLQDSSLNNLVHPSGYQTCMIGELGDVKKTGRGKQSMILIPGLGFGGDVYTMEWMAYDPKENYKDIHIPVLVLMPDFKELLTHNVSDTISCRSYAAKQYLKYFHQVSWQYAIEGGNDFFTFRTIPDSRIFTWIDNPAATLMQIDDFLRSKSKRIESKPLK